MSSAPSSSSTPPLEEGGTAATAKTTTTATATADSSATTADVEEDNNSPLSEPRSDEVSSRAALPDGAFDQQTQPPTAGRQQQRGRGDEGENEGLRSRPNPLHRNDDDDNGDEEQSTRQETSSPRVAAEDILLQSASPTAGAAMASSSATSSTSLLTREETRTLQWATTGLGVLFVAVLVLTVLAMEQYRLVVLVGLMLVIAAFYLLLRVVQHVTENPTALHPAVHRWVKAVRAEYKNFVQDWREHVLLLTYHDQDSGNDRELGSAYRDMGDDPLSKGSAGAAPSSPQSRRPKSRIFRALVQPLAPWLSRRRERRQQHKQHKEHEDDPTIELQKQSRRQLQQQQRKQQQQQHQPAGDKKNPPNAPSYAPPDYALV